MGRTATGIDVGSSSARCLKGEVKGTTFVVASFTAVASPDGTIEGGWSALEPDFKPGKTRIGLTGRDVNVRYTRVPRVPDWQLRKLMRFEAEEIGGQSEAAVASDFNVLPEIPEIEGEDVVLLCMARESLLEAHADGLAELRGDLDAFTPNAIGLYNAFLHYGVVMEDTVLVANLGRENTDVVVVRGADLLFARNLIGGSKLFDEAIAQRFGIDESRAELFKIKEGTVKTGTAYANANQEKAAHAMMGPAGQILSLLQSSVLFCKNQVKLGSLKVDRVLLCGGGSRLDGLKEYLARGMGVPVEPFDPFVVVDTSKLDPEEAALLERNRAEAVVALGLATSASDPDAYSIEILPAAVQKRRDFLNGPAFLIAAAVLALLYLGFATWKTRGVLKRAEDEGAKLEAQYRRAKRHDQRTRALLEENAEFEGYADELYTLAGSGEQMLRALDAIERSLPADFWLEAMTSTWSSDVELGVPRDRERPILRVRGKAREGTDSPALLFEEFVGALRQRVPEARVKERMGDTASFFTLDLTLLAPRDPAAEDAGADQDGAGTEEEG